MTFKHFKIQFEQDYIGDEHGDHHTLLVNKHTTLYPNSEMVYNW